MTAPRLHVIPAASCDLALVLRRGPAEHAASLLWDRRSGDVRLGQWLKGRLYEFRSDLSPDGKHMVVFAGTGTHWWTAISRAPYLRALTYLPQQGASHGGGAFDDQGRVFFNSGPVEHPLQDGLRKADPKAFPVSTDGFHMGGLYAARMVLRGWEDCGGTGYEMVLRKPVIKNWTLVQSVVQGGKDRALISTSYTLCHGSEEIVTDWEWAEPWKGGLQVAREGALWHVPLGADGQGAPKLIHDFTGMTFQAIAAPYEGIST